MLYSQLEKGYELPTSSNIYHCIFTSSGGCSFL